MSDRKLVIFTDAALEGDDTVGSLGMVAYWAVKGKVTQSYFFSGTVPCHILESMQGDYTQSDCWLRTSCGSCSAPSSEGPAP